MRRYARKVADMGLQVGEKKRLGDVTMADMAGVKNVRLLSATGQPSGSEGPVSGLFQPRGESTVRFDVTLPEGLGLVEIESTCPAHSNLQIERIA